VSAKRPLASAGGEAWPLTTVVQVEPVPVLFNIFTSGRLAYDALATELHLELRLRNTTPVAFVARQLYCRDVLLETRALPAPKSCKTSRDGLLLELVFHRHHALRPATDYFFVAPLRLIAPSSDRVERIVNAQIYEGYTEIDSFAIVLPSFVVLTPGIALGPRLRLFEVAPATATELRAGEPFVLIVTLAAQSDGHKVDPGLQDTVRIWAVPFSVWDFAAAAPCVVELAVASAGTETAAAGTCRFLRFPDAGGPVVRDAFGINAVELTPTEQIWSAAMTFRLRLVAPPSGGSLMGQNRWFAQAQRGGEPSQHILESQFGVAVALTPRVTVAWASNVAAGSTNKVVIAFSTGMTFGGEGAIMLIVPPAFSVVDVRLDVPGYGRLGGVGEESGIIAVEGNSVIVELHALASVWGGATYGLMLTLRNPNIPTFPAACADALSALSHDIASLTSFSATPFSTAAPQAWRLGVEVGVPVQLSRTVNFQAFNVLPQLRGASISPSQYAVGVLRNTLTVFFKLSVSLLTTDASIQLSGPTAFRFFCLSLVAPAAPLSFFPSVAECSVAPGFFLLDLVPDRLQTHSVPLSFKVDVRNPSRQEALLLDEQIRAAAEDGAIPRAHPNTLLSASTVWALMVASRKVPCQAQVELTSPYKTSTWRLFQRPLLIDRLSTTNARPGREAFVIFLFRFSSRILTGASIAFLTPWGFQFTGVFEVGAESTGAEASLPLSFPIKMDGIVPNTVSLHLIGSTLTMTTYGLRAKVLNSLTSPVTGEEALPNAWTILATTAVSSASSTTTSLHAHVGLASRFDAGSVEGYQLSALQGCDVQPSERVFGRDSTVTISFVLHHSLYSTSTSRGSIQVVAPDGFIVPGNCNVAGPLPSLDIPQGRTGNGFRFFTHSQCQGAGRKAVITLDQANAVLEGSHMRFRLDVTNPLVTPLIDRWEIATYQGFQLLETCENAVSGFSLTRALVRASYEPGGIGEDPRADMRSVYRFAFIYPERTADEEAEIIMGSLAITRIRVTVPEGFRTLPACLNGATGTNVLDGVEPLPPFVTCVGGGRHAEFTVAAPIQPLTLYAFSFTAVNPPTGFPYEPTLARWMLQVDGASAGNMQRPQIRLLREVRLIPGDWRAMSDGHWTKVLFRTATAVPVGGGIAVVVPYIFRMGECLEGTIGIFEAGTGSMLGDAALALGTPCRTDVGISSGQPHRITMHPLTAPLAADSRYVVVLLVGNGDVAEYESEVPSWLVYTIDTNRETIDMSVAIPSFKVIHGMGSVSFTPLALSVPPGMPLAIDVELTLLTAARRGALVFYPPPLVRVACGELGSSALLPLQTECIVQGASTEWLDQRLVLRSWHFPWSANRPYRFNMQVYEMGYELPFYRRTWLVSLVAGLQPDSESIIGFVVSSRAVGQWRWRGLLQGLVVSNQNPALSRRYTTYLDFTTASELTHFDELWIRPPPEIVLHSFTCRKKIADAASDVTLAMKLIPVYCDIVEPVFQPCLPHVWETGPCSDAASDAAVDSRLFAHRRGLRIPIGRAAAGKFVRVSVEATPVAVFSDSAVNVWTVSTWRDEVELDVAQVAGYAVQHWIDVTRFLPSSVAPEADVEIEIEWWMPVPLAARGRVVVRSPSWISAVLLHDLSEAGSSFDLGNLPLAETLQAPKQDDVSVTTSLDASPTSIEVFVCCQLEAMTRYHFRFGCRNPPFKRMPAPSATESNVWSILTRAPDPSKEILHQQIIQGYRLSRPFRAATVALHTERLVGAVGTVDLGGKTQVAIEFMLPFATALHGPAEELHLIAPSGWEFPAVCILENVRLGPWTGIDNCRAMDRELVLVIAGHINPGKEDTIFGFVAAVQPPLATANQDIWVLQAFAPVGSEEDLVDAGAEERASGGEVELRLTSVVFGMSRPSTSGAYDTSIGGSANEIIAWAQLVPRRPRSLWSSWRPPKQMFGIVFLRLPATMALDITNATLHLSAPRGLLLRCAFSPEPFLSGTLPPGVLCFDAQSSNDRYAIVTGMMPEVEAPYQVILTVNDLIPLRPSALYNFTVAVHVPGARDGQPPPNSRWPMDTSWSLVVIAGSTEFRTMFTSAPRFDGEALAPQAIRDFGLLTSTTRGNVLVEVSLLFSVGSRLPLPTTLEVWPPSAFRLDTAPSPLHPALQPHQRGVNPFSSASWQDRAMAKIRTDSQLISSGIELYGKRCTLFHLMLAKTAEQIVAMPEEGRPQGSLCGDPPTLEASLMQTCRADTYKAVPGDIARCSVLDHKAVVTLHRRPISSYRTAQERDDTYCSRFICQDRFDHVWLPSGQYRLTLRGFNPPETPADNDNIWSLVITGEVRELGGGPRSAIEPRFAAETPGYHIDAATEYSDSISSTGGSVLRGGAQWYDDGDRLQANAGPPFDRTSDGRRIVLTTASSSAIDLLGTR